MWQTHLELPEAQYLAYEDSHLSIPALPLLGIPTSGELTRSLSHAGNLTVHRPCENAATPVVERASTETECEAQSDRGTGPIDVMLEARRITDE